MSKPLATVKLTRGPYDFYLPSGKSLCVGGLMKVFDFPETAKQLWFLVYPRPAKNRCELRFEQPCPTCVNSDIGYRCPGIWLVDGKDREIERPADLQKLAKKHNRTVFYVECEYE